MKMLRRHRFLQQNEKFLLLLLQAFIIWAPVPDNIRPPNIYKWIEENAHICTIVPSNGEDLINFLSMEEGLKCALCPELKQKEVPTMACAVEVSPNDVDVDIGCHPIPELCVLELKNRYAEFYMGSPPGPEGPSGGPPGPPGSPGGNPGGNPPAPKRSEEEIFQATANVFSENPNELGGITEINIDEEVEETLIGTQKREEEVKEILDILHGRETTSTTTTTTISPTMGMFPLTTIRANLFSMPGGQGIPLSLSMQEVSAHSRTTTPILDGPHGPPGGGGGDVEMPMDMANGKGTGGSPFSMQKRVGGEEVEEVGMERQRCKDAHELCCFWAISGECDGNPFWMRVKCPMTCGTCGCEVKNADKCKSTGVKCVLPSTSTSATSTPTSSSADDDTTASTLVAISPEPTPPSQIGPRRRTRPTPPPRMPGHRPQRPKHHQKTSGSTTQQTMVAMTNSPLIAGGGDWSAVDFGNYANEEDEEEQEKAGPPSGAGSFPSVPPPPFFVELSVSTTGYPPDEALLGANDDVRGQGGGGGSDRSALDQTVPIEPAVTSESTTVESPSSTFSRDTCFNYHKLCDFWAKMGECSNNPFWMRPHCQKACQSCGETLGDISTPQPRPGCTNEHILCPFWAFIGECGRNPRWMGLHCLASCQLC